MTMALQVKNVQIGTVKFVMTAQIHFSFVVTFNTVFKMCVKYQATIRKKNVP